MVYTQVLEKSGKTHLSSHQNNSRNLSAKKTKLPETLHYIYDPNFTPQNFVNITEIPSETIQKLSINHENIEIINYNAETQPFTCTNITENTNTSLEVSSIENMDTTIHSQQSESRINETTETDSNSTPLGDGTLFASHTVNTLIDFEDNDQKNNQNNDNTNTNHNSTTNTTDNTHIYQIHQHRQPVNSTEWTQNSKLLNTTIPKLPNVNTHLPRLHRQNSVHFKTEPIILNNSAQPTQGTTQNIQITPQQLVNIVRQINSQSAQQSTNCTDSLLFTSNVYTNAITCTSQEYTKDVSLPRRLGSNATIFKSV